jgi:hypothetical protein
MEHDATVVKQTPDQGIQAEPFLLYVTFMNPLIDAKHSDLVC